MKLTHAFSALIILLSACGKKSSGGGGAIITPPPVMVPATFAKGADVSWVTQMEASGIKFYNSTGNETELITF